MILISGNYPKVLKKRIFSELKNTDLTKMTNDILLQNIAE